MYLATRPGLEKIVQPTAWPTFAFVTNTEYE